MKRNLLQRLVGPLAVLRVRFTDAENYTIHLFVLACDRDGFRMLKETAGPDAAALKKECAIRPVLIRVCGHGVITKPVDGSPLVEKVTADPETFAWSFSDQDIRPGQDSRAGTISFVRREQIGPLEAYFAENGIFTGNICYDSPAAEPEQDARLQAERFCRDRMKWRIAVRPTHEGCMIAKSLSRRLRLPVLGLMLLLLIVGTLAADSLKDRRAEQQTLLTAQEKTRGASQARSGQRRAAVAEFSHRLAYRHAWLLDRTASHVPPEITLTSLAVQPLIKKLEDAKDPLFASETLSVRGRTDDAAAVSRLMADLKSDPPVREAKLEQLEQNRENGLTEFKITVAL